MNYTQYLKSGNQVQSQEQEIMQIVDAFKQNPEETLSQIPEENRPKFLQQMGQLAEQLQDSELGELVQQVAQSIGLLKCGGKVRAKIKKACGGKKMEKGGEALVKKEAKGVKPCPCTLHKVGGKLIEVDCNGIPVAKNGAVLKFADPAGALPTVTFGKNKNGVNTYTIGNRTYVGYSGTFNDINGTAPVQYMNLLRDAQKWANETNGSAYKQMNGNVYSKFGSDRLYGKVSKDGKTLYYSNLGASDAKWNSDTNLWEREGYTYTPYKMSNGQDSFKWVQNTPSESQDSATELPEVPVVGQKPKSNLPYDTFVQNNLKSLQSRQEWVKNNADYLKSKGWSDEEISGYKGQGDLNIRLANQLGDLDAWKQQQSNQESKLESPYKYLTIGRSKLGVAQLPNSRVSINIPELKTTFTSSNIGLGPSVQNHNWAQPIVRDENQDIANNNQEVPSQFSTSVQNSYSGPDKLKAQRFQKTGNLLANDAKLQAILKREFGNNGKDTLGSKRAVALMHIDSNYSGADRLRARKILDSYFTPSQKIGGKLNYKNYLKL